jgi:predicted chitinase
LEGTVPAAVLNYNQSHELITQETYYNCGPGSSQLVLDARGIRVTEAELSGVLGTTVNGTPSIDNIAAGLNHYDGESKYAAMWMPNDPPKPDEVNLMRERISRTVAWGRGCVANVVVPPANYPKAVPKSDPNLPGASGQSPGYAGGIVYHYVSILGADNTDDTVMIVDPGFQPSTYWVTVTQLASMVTPHGIVWASGAPPLAPAAPPAAPAPAAPAPQYNGSDAELLAKAMGNALPLQRYQELLPAMVECLKQAECNTENRVAFLLAQVGHESCGLLYQEEIADGTQYEGRADLGNTQPGDGPRFKGRGWIQLTGRHNYTAFSQWAFEKGIVPTPTYFVDNPTEAGSDKYAGLGTSWYWTVARPGINAMCDANDFVGVTQAINGGTNGLADREARLVVCREVASQLPQLQQGCTQPPTAPTVPAKPAKKPHPAPTGDGALDELIGAAPHHATTLGEYGPNPYVSYTVQDKLSHVARENTMWLPGRTLQTELREVIEKPDRPDTVLGHSINAAGLARVNFELLRRICEHLQIDTKDVI